MRRVVIVVVVGAVAALSACSSSSGTATVSTSISPGTTATTTIAPTTLATTAPVTAATTSVTPASFACGSAGVPDGRWSGPLSSDANASGTGPYGSATQVTVGSGSITMTVANGQVTAGSASFSATSTTTGRGVNGTGTIDATLTLAGGTVSGTALNPVVAGTVSLSGTVRSTGPLGKVTVTTPFSTTYQTTTVMRLVHGECRTATGVFLPHVAARYGGYAIYFGGIDWHGTPA